MKWYYEIAGGHTHVRVFMNGAMCGRLCFRNDEFEEIAHKFTGMVDFIDETRTVQERNGTAVHPTG